MDRGRRDPIDLGDMFSLGPKPMKKSLKETSRTASPQRQPPTSASNSSSHLSDLGSQLEGLGGSSTGAGFGSPAAPKRQTASSGQSSYQLDPFAELSLGDKPAQHHPMASRCKSMIYVAGPPPN